MAANKGSSNNFNPSSVQFNANSQLNANRGWGGHNQSRGRGGWFQNYNNGGNFNNYNSNQPNIQSWSANSNYRPTCQICYKSGHTAIDCYQRMNYAYQGWQAPAKPATMATATPMAASAANQTTWISNTRATDHFMPDLNNIPDNQAYIDSQLVSVGNGQLTLDITHR